MSKTIDEFLNEMGYTTPWCVECTHKQCLKGRKVFKAQLKELIKECLPSPTFNSLDSEKLEEVSREIGRNKAIEELTKNLKERGLL